MCFKSIKAIERNHPVITKFAHLLVEHPEWLLFDASAVVSDMIHYGFVLNWATETTLVDPELLKHYRQGDKQREDSLLKAAEATAVPEDARFLVNGKTNDPLFSALDIFAWMKLRSVQAVVDKYSKMQHIPGMISSSPKEDQNLVLNILEAVWVDHKRGYEANAAAGQWLASRAFHSSSFGTQNQILMHTTQPKYSEVYLSWNLAFSFSLSQWWADAVAMLLIPSVSGAEADSFLTARIISLHFSVVKLRDQLLTKNMGPPRLPLTRSAIASLGSMNRDRAFDLDFNPESDWSGLGPPNQKAKAQFERFGRWEKASSGAFNCKTVTESSMPDIVSPSTATETMLVQSLAQVLNTPEQHLCVMADVFLSFGMDSLKAAEFTSLLEGQGLTLSIEEVYQSTTLCQLGRMLDSKQRNPQSGGYFKEFVNLDQAAMLDHPLFVDRLSQCGYNKRHGDLVYPLTRVQRRMLLAHKMDPKNGTYHINLMVKVKEETDIDRMEECLREMLRRNPVLCTLYPGDDPLVGVIHPTTAEDFVVHKVDDFSSRSVEEFKLKPFVLDKDISIRVWYFVRSREFLLVFHHVGFDEGSFKPFLNQFHSLFEGTPDAIEKAGYDYVKWAWIEFSREIKNGPPDSGFWRTHLFGDDSEHESQLPVLRLPNDREVASKDMSTTSVVAHQEVQSPVFESLKVAAATIGVPPFVICLFSFEVLLKLYSGQEDVVVGIPSSTRGESQASWSIVGMFVNTLALRLRGEIGDQKLKDMLNSRWGLWQKALQQSSVPYDALSAEVRGKTGLFQASLNYMVGIDTLETANAMVTGPFEKCHIPTSDISKSKFDVEFKIVQPHKVTIAVRDNIWTRQTAARFLDCYVNLLAQIPDAISSSKLCSELSFLSPNEVLSVSKLLCGPKRVWGELPLMHQVFEKWVNLTPEATALRFGDKTMTYCQVEAQANRLANYLLCMRGVRVAEPVGVLLPRGFSQIVAILGILKSGATVVPMDTDYPSLRLQNIIEDSGMIVCVSSEENDLYMRLQGCAFPIESDEVRNQPSSRPCGVSVGLDNLCYVLYTSGSTGKPKGVDVEHRSIANYHCHLQSSFAQSRLGPDRVLHTARLTWDVAYSQYLLAFGSGGELCLLSDEQATSPVQHLSEAVKTMKVTLLRIPPALVDGLQVEKGQDCPDVIFGGDKLNQRQVNCVEALGGKVFNFYGPTETTITVCDTSRCRPELEDQGAFSAYPIGKAIHNVELQVLDQYKRQVPIGVVGELLVGGAALARGYRNRPEETAKAFIQHAEGSSQRLYRTGDLVKLLPSGMLEFVGRRKSSDSYVKLGGYRIELGEISCVLEQHDAINRAVVVVDEGRSRLVAFVASKDQSVNEREATEWCQQHLVDYMIPKLVVRLEKFPLTLNGKIDYQRWSAILTNLVTTGPTDKNIVPCANDAERHLVKIVASLMDIPEGSISVTVDIFDSLGVNSLKVAQLVSEIRKSGVLGEVSIREIFELTSIRDIANLCSERGGDLEGQQDSCATQKKAQDFDTEIAQPAAAPLAIKLLALVLTAVFITISLYPSFLLLEKKFVLGNANLWLIPTAVLAFLGCLLGITFLAFCLMSSTFKNNIDFRCGSFHRLLAWYVYDRLWSCLGTVLLGRLGGTPWLPWVYRLFGAKIGTGVVIEEHCLRMPKLVTIGSNAYLSSDMRITNIQEDGSGIQFGAVSIGAGTVIHSNAVIGVGSSIGNDVEIEPLVNVPPGSQIRSSSTVSGTNMRVTEDATVRQDDLDDPTRNNGMAPLLLDWLNPFVLFIPWYAVSLVYLQAAAVIFQQYEPGSTLYCVDIATSVLLMPVWTLIAVVVSNFTAGVLRYLLLLRLPKAGQCQVQSLEFVRRTAATDLIAHGCLRVPYTQVDRFVLEFFHGATFSERSHPKLVLNHRVEPQLVTCGKNVFFANGVVLRTMDVHRGGKANFQHIRIGDDTLLMDRVVVQAGSNIPAHTTIGAGSYLKAKRFPLATTTRSHDGDSRTVILGCPAFASSDLPSSSSVTTRPEQPLQQASHRWTTHCSRWCCAIRNEALAFPLLVYVVQLPILGLLALLYWVVLTGDEWLESSGGTFLPYIVVGLVGGVGWAICLLCTGWLVKNLVVGNFGFSKTDGGIDVYSWKFLRFLYIHAMVQWVTTRVVVKAVDDFRFTRWIYNWLGAKIHETARVASSANILETDLLEIRQGCVVDAEATLFSHTVDGEDGNFGFVPMVIGANSRIGQRAILIPGCQVEENVQVKPLAHVLAGESLSSGGSYGGNPIEWLPQT